MASSCGCSNQFISKRSLAGPDAEGTIVCPDGFFANGDKQGNVWCENDKGERKAATIVPFPKEGMSAGTIIGIGVLVAGGLALAAYGLRAPSGARSLAFAPNRSKRRGRRR